MEELWEDETPAEPLGGKLEIQKARQEPRSSKFARPVPSRLDVRRDTPLCSPFWRELPLHLEPYSYRRHTIGSSSAARLAG